MKKIIKEIIPYLAILILVFIIRTYLVTPIAVNGPSMQKTLYTNDIMLLYKKGVIDRHKIVVLKHEGENLIKRIMAMPGDTIRCEEGIIYVNDKVDMEYGYGTSMDFSEFELGEDEYFVIGDNREDSLDSRYFGPIKKEDILGTTNLIIFPLKRIGKVK